MQNNKLVPYCAKLNKLRIELNNIQPRNYNGLNISIQDSFPIFVIRTANIMVAQCVVNDAQ